MAGQNTPLRAAAPPASTAGEVWSGAGALYYTHTRNKVTVEHDSILSLSSLESTRSDLISQHSTVFSLQAAHTHSMATEDGCCPPLTHTSGHTGALFSTVLQSRMCFPSSLCLHILLRGQPLPLMKCPRQHMKDMSPAQTSSRGKRP